MAEGMIEGLTLIGRHTSVLPTQTPTSILTSMAAGGIAGNSRIHERTSKRLTIEGATRNRPKVPGLRPAFFFIDGKLRGKGAGAKA